MQEAVKKQLASIACRIRMGAIEAVYSAKSGHPGGSLSIADTLAYLYFEEMKINPQNPKDENRDRFVLSKGHCTPGYYAALALKGYFPIEELKKFRKTNEILQGHPDMKHIPGVDMSSGSLGQGISAACGMALSAKISNKDYRVYTVVGDGESQEGQVWEAAMFAGSHKLDNLVVIIDHNGLQICGKICESSSPEPLPEKFAAFGFNVIRANAHDFDELDAAFKNARECKGKPSVIIQESIKGKGVSFMENNVDWHGNAPNAEQYEIAMKELNAALASLEV